MYILLINKWFIQLIIIPGWNIGYTINKYELLIDGTQVSYDQLCYMAAILVLLAIGSHFVSQTV